LLTDVVITYMLAGERREGFRGVNDVADVRASEDVVDVGHGPADETEPNAAGHVRRSGGSAGLTSC